jgi:osmotically-inducible protein OsmY
MVAGFSDRRAGNPMIVARPMKRSFLRGMVYGWLAAYFFDPQLGRGRRALARDRLLARGRRLVRRARRAQRYAASTAYGKSQAYLHRAAPKALPDDATLAHKVETVIFRDPAVPKGQINVNAEEGVVTLRGEVPRQSMIDALVARAREVGGVRRVESLLHLPGEAAPMRR